MREKTLWKQRAVLAVSGGLLLAVGFALSTSARWIVPHKTQEAEYSPFFLGVLSRTAPKTTVLESRREQAFLFMYDVDEGGFRPFLTSAKGPPAWGKVIPTEWVNFSPETVLKAFEKTPASNWKQHGYCDAIQVKRIRTKSIPDSLLLAVDVDAFRSFWKLTFYSSNENGMELQYASYVPIDRWSLIDRFDPPVLVTKDAGGWETYRWENSRFVRDESLKQSLPQSIRNSFASESDGAEILLFPLITLGLLFWIYRLVRFLLVLWGRGDVGVSRWMWRLAIIVFAFIAAMSVLLVKALPQFSAGTASEGRYLVVWAGITLLCIGGLLRSQRLSSTATDSPRFIVPGHD